jgi:hypothetical protein
LTASAPYLDLRDKIIHIYKVNRENDVALQDARIEMHHGRFFLVGLVPDGGSANDWLAGLTTYVSWDQIEEFVVFDSLEEYHRRLSLAWSDNQLQ